MTVVDPDLEYRKLILSFIIKECVRYVHENNDLYVHTKSNPMNNTTFSVSIKYPLMFLRPQHY